MGRRGPLPKWDEAHGTTIAVLGQATRTLQDVPPPPPGLLAESRRTWAEFWMSATATFVDRAGYMQRLVRWITDVDLWNRIQRDLRPSSKPLAILDGQPVQTIPGVFDPRRPWLGKGSTDQISVHANAKLVDELDARIHRAEVEYGMTPYAGVRLGLAGVQGALTAEQLARLIDERARREPVPVDEDWAEGFAPG